MRYIKVKKIVEYLFNNIFIKKYRLYSLIPGLSILKNKAQCTIFKEIIKIY
jgi:hypothetical protein